MSERRIIALNNSGVDALSCGRFQEAILSFRHAIACMPKMQTPQEAEKMNHAMPFSPRPIPLGCLLHVGLSEICPTNMFEVYQRAFVLPKKTSILRHITKTLAVLVYNLALAKHLVGLLLNNNAYLNEAQHYYSFVLSPDFMSHFRSHISNTNHTLIVLGCANNLGHIHSTLWRISNAHACYDLVEDIMSYLPDGDSLLQDEDGQFFFSMLTCGATHTFNLAPAA